MREVKKVVVKGKLDVELIENLLAISKYGGITIKDMFRKTGMDGYEIYFIPNSNTEINPY